MSEFASRLPPSQTAAETYTGAAPHLRRPFTPEAVRFKVQATYPKNDPTGALVVGYIDARLVIERLNMIVPGLWQDDYEPVGPGLLMCSLTVDGLTRKDVGEGAGKALYSDAFKRAAVKFGIGVSLYAIPQTHLKLADGSVKSIQGPKGPSLAITPAGEKRVRAAYKDWLDSHGVAAFGEPLSHGDVEGAQGDVEAVEEQQVVHAPVAAASPPNDFLPLLEKAVAAVNDDKWVALTLVSLGVEDVPDRVSLDTLASLPADKADAFLNKARDYVRGKRAETDRAVGVAIGRA